MGAAPKVKTRVSNILGTLYFPSDISSAGRWQPSSVAESSLPRWKDLQKVLEMPVVGSVIPGYFVCSYFEWEYSKAEVAAVSSTQQYWQPFRLGMGMENWVELGPLTSAPNGAVALRAVRWRLSTKLPPCAF